ncbi:MAG TPA: hypothetical protein VHT97_01465 [Acidimicrobiales bacterium]|jgi:hypothetical protein|nr:hypothetical protein [Acidimicrobiales bacterium]
MDSLAALVTAILATLGSLLTPAAPPAKALPHGAVGYDISWPQCGRSYPAAGAFGIVGVTGGRPYTGNPCLGSEYAAAAATPGGAGFYINTANPGTASTTLNWYGQKSPDPSCGPGHEAACAYDYGFTGANEAVSYAQAQTGHSTNTTWWLDVETGNSWSPTDPGANLASIRGAVDALQHQPGVLVGIYSTRYQWTQITGGAPLALANWVAGASNVAEAQGRCSPDWSATGGPVVLTQFFGTFDGNYAC